MDFIVEFAVYILVELGLKKGIDKKTPKWKRNLIVVAFLIPYLIILGGLLYFSVVIFKKDKFMSFAGVFSAFCLVWATITRINEIKAEKQRKENEEY